MRKPHRLPDEEYKGRKSVSFTACERLRRPLLANPATFEIVTGTLTEACARHTCSAPIYVLMPDHFHVLFLGHEEQSDSRLAMTTFKRLSGTAFRGVGEMRWQEGSYDTVVRWGQWGVKARYIARNPYRAGLVSSEERWPYMGSVGHDFEEVVWDAFW